MASSAVINGIAFQIGDSVWWFGNRRADGDPCPATILGFSGGSAIDIHVHETGRLALHRCVRHVKDPALNKLTPVAIAQTGVWKERDRIVDVSSGPKSIADSSGEVVDTPPASEKKEEQLPQVASQPASKKPTTMEKLLANPLKTSPQP